MKHVKCKNKSKINKGVLFLDFPNGDAESLFFNVPLKEAAWVAYGIFKKSIKDDVCVKLIFNPTVSLVEKETHGKAKKSTSKISKRKVRERTKPSGKTIS